jgi:nitric oxide reductase NorD protein
VSATLDLRPLRVIASAMAGRAVEVAPAERGSRTWTDGRTIFLESDVDALDRLRLLGVQASLLAAGSFRPDLVRRLRRHRPLATRYLAVEGHRAVVANEANLPIWLPALIERGLAGAVASADESLDFARRTRGLVPAWELGTIDLQGLAADPDDEDRALSPTARARPAQVDPETLDVLDQEDGVDGVDLGDLLSSPVGGGSALGRLLAKLLRPTRARDGGGPPGADAPTHLSRSRPGLGRSVVSTSAASGASDGEVRGGPTSHWYPEWDERRHAYRPDWCQVLDGVAEAGPASAGALLEPADLRRALARLGAGLTPYRRRRQGDDVDIDALVESRVDRRAGRSGSDDIYLEVLRRRRDLSVLVLLDVSGSATEPGIAGRSVHEHQRDAAAALTTVLQQLGDRVALAAFSSSGRTAVRVSTVKGFDDAVDGVTSRRLAGLQPGGYTRLGAAIRHGAAALEAHGGTSRRLLVVLSDGFAYDHGYEGRYGEADARRALLEARRRGLGCLCLSVGADAEPAALQRVFGTAAHGAVPTVEHLAGSIGRLFAAALRSADVQRRRYQRTERARVRLLIEGSAA